jgi:hypothetical protein
VADRTAQSLNRSALAWAVSRALRLAIGTCVVGLVVATTLTGESAERLATVAYLAAIFAAGALIAGRFLPAPEEPRGANGPAFPAFLTYSISVAIFLGIAASLASQPGAEVLALIGCSALVVIAFLARCGALTALNAALLRGGFLAAATRYAVIVCIAALVLAAIASADAGESLVAFAYRIAVLAAVLFCSSLVAPTPLGARIARSSARLVKTLDRLAQQFVFERTATYAAVVAIALIVPAILLPAPFAEPFVIVAYAAAAAAAFGVAMECRRLRS